MNLFEWICIKGGNPNKLVGLQLKLKHHMRHSGWHNAMLASVELGGIRKCREKSCQHHSTCWGAKSGLVGINGYIPDLFIHILDKTGTPVYMDAHYICSLLPMDILAGVNTNEKTEVSLTKLKKLNKGGNFCVLCGKPAQDINLGGFVVGKGCIECEEKLYQRENGK